MKRERQVLENYGYATHALTNEKGVIFGISRDCFINKWDKEGKFFYWSDVYCTGRLTVIVRKGVLLNGITDKELSELHEQSKVNLHE